MLTHLKGPQVLSTKKVQSVQDKIAERLGVNTNLVFRCDITKDISAAGSTSIEKGWQVRAEVVGPQTITPSQLKTIENHIASTTGHSVKLCVWSRVDLVVTDRGYVPLDEYIPVAQGSNPGVARGSGYRVIRTGDC